MAFFAFQTDIKMLKNFIKAARKFISQQSGDKISKYTILHFENIETNFVQNRVRSKITSRAHRKIDIQTKNYLQLSCTSFITHKRLKSKELTV